MMWGGSVLNLKLVYWELYYFGEIAVLFPQIRGYRIVLYLSLFEDFIPNRRMIKSETVSNNIDLIFKI